MIKRKTFKEKGRTGLSQQFKEFKKGSKVVLKYRLGVKGKKPFPVQFNGRVAEVTGKSGRAYIVKFLNGKVSKILVLNPIYLKSLNL